MVTAATIYMSLLGAEGLAGSPPPACATRPSWSASSPRRGRAPRYFRAVLPRVGAALGAAGGAGAGGAGGRGILGGYDLSRDYPGAGPCLLVCATETRTATDIESYFQALNDVLRQARVA
jgi:glycine dehydrogenase subunit 1